MNKLDYLMKHNDGEKTNQHLARLQSLSQSLCPLGVAIYHYNWDYLAMGSWSLIAGTRHDSFLFTWDGREGFLSVRGPFHAGRGHGTRSPIVAEGPLGAASTADPFVSVRQFFEARGAEGARLAL